MKIHRYRVRLDTETALGGINSKNILRTLHGSVSPSGRSLDGVAVVSDIMASKTPLESAKALAHSLTAFNHAKPPVFSLPFTTNSVHSFVKELAELLRKIKDITPVVHQVLHI